MAWCHWYFQFRTKEVQPRVKCRRASELCDLNTRGIAQLWISLLLMTLLCFLKLLLRCRSLLLWANCLAKYRKLWVKFRSRQLLRKGLFSKTQIHCSHLLTFLHYESVYFWTNLIHDEQDLATTARVTDLGGLQPPSLNRNEQSKTPKR